MPGYANPQNLNRYSYVLNNPLRYTDPTGHKACDDFDSNGQCVTAPGGGGSGFGGLHPKKPKKDKDNNDGVCDTNGNGVADMPCAGLTTRDWDEGFNRLGSSDLCPVTSLIECYYLHASLNMGQDPMNIDMKDFQALLLAIYYEVKGRNSVDLVVSSMSFDTPFYDHGVLGGIAAIPGTGCINGLGCYARHELNYIAQGEISAAAGESRTAGLFRVNEWKLVFGLGSRPSTGTLTMWNIGYVFYNSMNGFTTPP